MRNERRIFDQLVRRKHTKRHHCAGLVTYVVLADILYPGAVIRICLCQHMEGAAVKGKIVYIRAAHISLQGRVDVADCNPELFRLFSVDG